MASVCKICGAPMVTRTGKYGEFQACSRYPLCMGKNNLVNGEKVVRCPKCDSPMKKRNGRRGEFYGCTKFSDTGCNGTRKVEEVEIYEKGVEVKEPEKEREQEEITTIEFKKSQVVEEKKQVIDIPVDDSTTVLIPTSQYPHLKFKFENFNPVQSRVFEYYSQDINCVVAASTSAGKTTVAEMFMAHSISQGKKAIFLSPLKAVSQEKHNDWTNESHDWSKLNVSIVTGDYALTDKRVAELNVANVIIMTTEMLDSRTRRIQTEKNDWLLDVRTVVCDESHMISMAGRGDKVESAMMRFTKQNPSCRIVFLSATMPNVSELANWLTSLNGKKTELINSSYRPIELGMHYETYRDRGKYAMVEEYKIQKALEIIASKSDEQFIIFVHAKNTGRIIKQQLEQIYGKDKVDFHYGDLTLQDRIEIEQKTRTREIRFLIATSGLAWGVNI